MSPEIEAKVDALAPHQRVLLAKVIRELGDDTNLMDEEQWVELLDELAKVEETISVGDLFEAGSPSECERLAIALYPSTKAAAAVAEERARQGGTISEVMLRHYMSEARIEFYGMSVPLSQVEPALLSKHRAYQKRKDKLIEAEMLRQRPEDRNRYGARLAVEDRLADEATRRALRH